MIILEDELYSYWDLPENLSQRSDWVHKAAPITKNVTYLDTSSTIRK